MSDAFAWASFFLSLARLLAVMAVSLALAQVLESLRWTEHIARLTAPLARFAHFGPAAGASFALAFFSPAAASALLAEHRAKGALSAKELVAATLFNSTPTFLAHLPTLAALAFAFLGPAAAPYITLIFLAAVIRTLAVALYGHWRLPRHASQPTPAHQEDPRPSWLDILHMAGRRLTKRLKKLLIFTVPIYSLLFFLQQAGAFASLEQWLTGHTGLPGLVSPQALSVVAVHIAADSGAAFSAAAALLATGAITPQDAVLALLAGNILSSPVRAFRHQLPSYAGYFNPGSALILVAAGQALRALSLALVTVGYAWLVSIEGGI